MYDRNGLPGFPGSRAVARSSYEALDTLRRPRAIEYFKAQGLSLKASTHIYTASISSQIEAFSFGAGKEVKTSAGRNYFGRLLTIFGTKDGVYSLRGEQSSFVPTFSAERKSCLCGEKQTLLRQTFIGANKEVETSAGRNYFGWPLTIFGTKDGVYSLRGEQSSFVPTFSAERKSCLCGEKQTLLRHFFTSGSKVQSLIVQGFKDSMGGVVKTLNIELLNFSTVFNGANTEVKTSAGRKYFGVLPTTFGAGQEVKTSAGRNYFGRLLTIFGTKDGVYSLRGEQSSFVLRLPIPPCSYCKNDVLASTSESSAYVVCLNYTAPQIPSFRSKPRFFAMAQSGFGKPFSAERKSCLCGEKQTLLRQTFIGANKEVKTSAGRNYFGWPLKPYSNVQIIAGKKESTMSQIRRWFCGLVLMSVLAGVEAFGSTLSTNFAEVHIDNLKIGGVYNLTEAVNYPMWVSYSGDAPIELKYESVAPSNEELRAGYEPIPDVSWITVSKKNVSLLPDETATADVTISVPNDEKYLGEKYQAYVLVTSVPPKQNEGRGYGFRAGVKRKDTFQHSAKASDRGRA